MPKIKVSLGIGFSNCNRDEVIDIDCNDWESCATDVQREDLMFEYAREWADEYIEIGCLLVE